MQTILKSDVFEEWIDNLRDRAGAAQVLRRLARLERGNPGRVAPVGEGVSELKIDFGPSYRVYFGQRGEELMIILGGGDKSSQDRDIKAAKKLWDEWKEQDRLRKLSSPPSMWRITLKPRRMQFIISTPCCWMATPTK